MEGLEFRSCKPKEIPRREWSYQEQKDHREVKKDKDEERGKYYCKLEVGQQDHMASLFHLQTVDRSEDGERKMLGSLQNTCDEVLPPFLTSSFPVNL